MQKRKLTGVGALPEVNFYSFDMQCINFCVTLVKFLFVIPSCIKGCVDMVGILYPPMFYRIIPRFEFSTKLSMYSTSFVIGSVLRTSSMPSLSVPVL